MTKRVGKKLQMPTDISRNTLRIFQFLLQDSPTGTPGASAGLPSRRPRDRRAMMPKISQRKQEKSSESEIPHLKEFPFQCWMEGFCWRKWSEFSPFRAWISFHFSPEPLLGRGDCTSKLLRDVSPLSPSSSSLADEMRAHFPSSRPHTSRRFGGDHGPPAQFFHDMEGDQQGHPGSEFHPGQPNSKPSHSRSWCWSKACWVHLEFAQVEARQ